jgi:hypothetical protein
VGASDVSGWWLNALGKFEGTLVGMQTQLNRIETKLGEVEKEVSGHGKWMHTLKAFAAVMAFLLSWIFANAVWPWAKSKMGMTATP